MANADMPDTDNTKSEISKPGARFSLPRLVPFIILLAGLGTAYSTGLHEYLSFDSLRDNRQALLDWRSENILLAALAFILAYGAATAISLPGAIWLTIAAGFLFGTSQGAIFVVVAATFGATVIFLAARYAFGDYFTRRAGAAVKKMEKGFNANALSYLFFLRLVPLFPFWLVNLVPALLNVRFRAFVIATFFGIMPGTFVYASLGDGLGVVIDKGEIPDLGIIMNPRIFGPLLGLAILALIPIGYRKFKALRAGAPGAN